jgi:hypothetical protein
MRDRRHQGAHRREVQPADLNSALAAVQSGLTLLKATEQPYLAMRADGAVPTGLRQAVKIYTNLCSRAGIQNHAARYAFARERRCTAVRVSMNARRAPQRPWIWDLAMVADVTSQVCTSAARDIPSMLAKDGRSAFRTLKYSR